MYLSQSIHKPDQQFPVRGPEPTWGIKMTWGHSDISNVLVWFFIFVRYQTYKKSDKELLCTLYLVSPIVYILPHLLYHSGPFQRLEIQCPTAPLYFSTYFLRIRMFSCTDTEQWSKSRNLIFKHSYHLIYSPYSIFNNCFNNIPCYSIFPGPESSSGSHIAFIVSLVSFNLGNLFKLSTLKIVIFVKYISIWFISCFSVIQFRWVILCRNKRIGIISS